nr:TRAP transporter large permease [uncultured Roseovarius sp.]
MINPGLAIAGMMVFALVVGVPIPFAIGAAVLLGYYLVDIPIIALAQTSYDALEGLPIITVPLFVLAGGIMLHGGIAERLIEIARTFLGKKTGSYALVTVVGCMFFAAMSGSGPATTAAIGAITIPAMLRQGFKLEDAGAVAASGGALGSLIPPSNLMIFYGIVSETSIPRLFLAGMIPGLITTLLLCLVAWLIARKKGYLGDPAPIEKGARWRSLWNGKWALSAPVVILGGIYGGIFTATEAAAVAVVYSLFICTVIYRQLTIAHVIDSIRQTALIAGTIIIVLGAAKGFGQLMGILEAPDAIRAYMGEDLNPFLLLMVMALILIITGTFMESIAQIILFTPLMLPVAVVAGVDPIAFGIIMVAACEIGFLTPPVGANLFVASRLTGLSVERLSVSTLPYLAAYLLIIVLVALMPGLATFLPTLAFG